MKFHLQRYLGSVVFIFLLTLSVGVGAAAGVLFVYNSDLPQVRSLEDYRPSVVTEVYADDGQPIGSFALERRILVTWEQLPKLLKDAIVSVEDQNFYEHWGIDFYGVARATLKNIMAGRVVEGGSTLTQQLSKNLFLVREGTAEKTLRRKIQEAMLSIQIERNYTKPQILTMYCNLGYLGHGQYGFAAAAEFYFGKNLKDLTIEEAALLAALPRSPTNYSPILNPDRALLRRNYAIDRMVAQKAITAAQGEEAKKRPIRLAPRKRPDELAPYFVEELRQYLEDKYGSAAVHESGLRVYTTLNVELQKIANSAVRQGLRDYDKRHGWRGIERNLVDEGATNLAVVDLPEWRLPIRTNDIVPGVVLSAGRTATVRIREYEAQLTSPDIAWTKAATPGDILKTGDVALFMIRSLNSAERKMEVSLEQKPKAQGALVAISTRAEEAGDVKAMVGGYDFDESKFNRATQAQRQTGSAFKPFVYAAAVDLGLQLDDVIIDAPINFGGYAPHNYDNKYEGAITVRHALGESRNIPAVKTLARIGVPTLIPYLRRLGITSKIEPYLPVALGASDITLMEMTSAYSTFPNDGVRVVPRLITRVTDYDGNVREENLPELRDVISAEKARLMVDLLQEPVRAGTAVKAKALGRPVAGKTGTTNDYTDAWFMGFTPSLTLGVWVGFDEKVTLGNEETGARAALPIWINVIQQAYKDKPIEQFQPAQPTEPKPQNVAEGENESTGRTP
ncbi:MAG TPA: PBP1A family penicillin-binding protein [Terriglobia bacterium]|nr:PBP1A family penicillin-binding protein [Terriglobia bacterium]